MKLKKHFHLISFYACVTVQIFVICFDVYINVFHLSHVVILFDTYESVNTYSVLLPIINNSDSQKKVLIFAKAFLQLVGKSHIFNNS